MQSIATQLPHSGRHEIYFYRPWVETVTAKSQAARAPLPAPAAAAVKQGAKHAPGRVQLVQSARAVAIVHDVLQKSNHLVMIVVAGPLVPYELARRWARELLAVGQLAIARRHERVRQGPQRGT